MVKLDRIEHNVIIPEGVTATIDGDVVTITGPKGSLSREFASPRPVSYTHLTLPTKAKV